MKDKILVKALREDGISAYVKEDELYIDKDHFPQKGNADLEDVKLDLKKTYKKIDETAKRLDLGKYCEKDWSESKKISKMVAKSITKAIKKYLDKCTNGYEPDNIEESMAKYVKKKTEKYIEKKFLAYIGDLTKEDVTNNNEEPDKECEEDTDLNI